MAKSNIYTDEFVFFSGSYLSQWYACKFIWKDRTYYSAEQFMMAAKARLFKDEETETEIRHSHSPSECKQLGKKIRGFDQVVWDENKEDIVYTGNFLKFTQNPYLLEKLILECEWKQCVECNPADRIWGIGLSMDSPDIYDPSKWLGYNLLGVALTELCEKLSYGIRKSERKYGAK